MDGWRGGNTNQSGKALQWFYYKENCIPKQGASADRISHVRNGGEQTVRTSDQLYFVDGYDTITCGWHKEHWTKGAVGTGSVDQQAVERHW